MSIYPRFNTNSNTFNSADIVSYEEQASGQTIVSLDLSSFVQKAAPVFESELYLKEGVNINYNGARQSTSFTDEYKSDLEENKEKLTSINYANNKTTFLEEVDLTGATVSLNDDQISQSKITGLVTRLSEIDTNLSNINSNDNDIANLNTTTATHTAQLSDIETLNTTQDGRLNVIETDVENITIRITDAEEDISNLEATDTQHDISLNELFGITSTLTNDVISLTNMDTDISNDLNTYKVSNDASIVSINDDITAIQAVDVGQNSRLDAIENLNTNQDGRLDVIETLNTTQDNRLDAVESKNVIQDASINLLETLTSSHSTDLSNLSSIQNANVANITTLQGENTTQSSQISTLESQMLTKHPTINNSNKLNVSYIGNGDVSNDKLSSLNDIRTDVSIQNQINTINDSISGLDALQDLDVINIPVLQTNVANLIAKDVTVDASLNALATDIATNVSAIGTNASDIASNLASINTTNTSVSNNANSISVLNSNVSALVSADGIHDTQISDLQNADTVLQANIDLKQDIISLTNKLDTGKIFDTSLNDTLDDILDTIDGNISLLNSSKQDNITTLNKLNTSLLNRDDNLLFCDATSSIQGQINSINSNIALLQGVDTTIINDIQSNFDNHDASITANTNAISTLQSLQAGDITSFNTINSNITNLTNTKHPLIDSNNKLNSSLLNRDDNLQHIDITSSLQTKLNSLDADVATKQNLIDNANKLDATLLNLNNNLQYADYGSSVSAKFASLDTSISTLNANDVSQATTNTNLQNQINTNASAITDLETFETNQLATNTTLQNNINNIDLSSKQDVLTNASSVVYVDITSGLQSSLNTLQSNIDNKHDVIDVNNRLDSGLIFDTSLNDTLDDILDTIDSNITTIQSSKQDVIDGANKLAIANVDLTGSDLANMDFSSSVDAKFTALDGQISTLTGLQNNDVVNFTAIDASLVDLYAVKQDVIDGSNKLAISSVDLTGSSLANMDFGSSVDAKFTAVDNSIATKNDIIDGSNKLSISNVDLTGSNLIYADYTSSINSKMTSLDGQIATLTATDVAQATTNTSHQNQINTANTNIATNTADITTANNNIALKLNATDYQPKIDDISSGSFASNILSYTFNEDTIFMNQLTTSVPFELNITVNSPQNNKTYKQKVIIDCLQYKGYINVLKINGSTVEIKYLNGDQAINLSPIMGYSNILQTLEMTYIGSSWFCLSKMQMFYNSTSNIDDVNPVIYGISNPVTIIVDTIYDSTDALDSVSADDNMDGALTVTVDMNGFDYTTVGAYTIIYTATDAAGNSTITNRTINVEPVPEIILYQNVASDIISMIDYGTYIPYNSDSAYEPPTYTFNVTGTGDWRDLNGYGLSGSSYQGFAQTRIRGFVAPNANWQSHVSTQGYNPDIADQIPQAHNVYISTSPYLYSNNIGNGMEYVGYTTGGNNYKNTQLASNSTTYEGEWVELTYPFHIDINSFSYEAHGNSVQLQRFPTKGVLLGSNDGTTYDLLHSWDYTTQTTLVSETVGTDSGKYSRFKLIFEKIGWTGSTEQKGFIVKNFKMYANKVVQI